MVVVQGDIEQLKEIAHQHNVILIEDAAQAIGSKFNKLLGTFWRISNTLVFIKQKI